ncbi:putative transcriptional regulator, FadR family [Streptomyces ambofaciens ATCC 23877]|uniref:Putative transcriptional regulator, FadR family n=1 Tax=Streptomyces ambofaciens (strain ATCC 23877 / 3486 / DSM 40053 / JCM 4204 / NBRC 12836 / NRRL B-2516) TaxID=278992 RepID=A0AE22_STRA7|nr:FCD domain-containing protein [Streptomyces ambofaciens]AKZ59594.1 putative transcriptional regulator, FadR family [Streptomyces ambofaciens ATCC 23877]CAJ88730.1 putative transcriptional regulator, FadR family [Streptomyces ambofaciens ATCC 23877]
MASYSGRGVHGQVVHRLGARIVGGTFAEGEILDIGALGAELDVSLTVMREALKVLAGKGLTDARQKRGTYVRERAHWNLLDADVIRWRMETGDGAQLLRDLADVRSVVEPAAARRAALHRTDADLTALRTALDAMGRARSDSVAVTEADAAFHRALLAATGNELLGRMDLLLEPGLKERDRLVHAHGDADDPVPSHRAVLDAVRDRDPARAEAAMMALLAKSAEDTDHLTSASPNAVTASAPGPTASPTSRGSDRPAT